MSKPMSKSLSKPADTTVIVGISGGVDSAVAALLLLEQGYKVQGLHMTNWDDDDDYCQAAQDYQDAQKVCKDLDIPLHHINFAKEYRDKVFADFLEEYRRGRTPNPDIACNRYIKFGDCLEYSIRLGADRIATGHYARITERDGVLRLLKAADGNKDQSYFLHAIRPEVLPRVMFPLGELNKPEVRILANERGLSNYARRDSTGICFIGERPFREFLQTYLPAQPGAMETPAGQVIGQHAGLMYYTLGQREGLGIGGVKGYPEAPWYVGAKDMQRNVLVVTQGRDDPLLYADGMQVEDLRWLSGIPSGEQFDCSVKTRYRQEDVPCTVKLTADGVRVRFHKPVWAVTPGQYGVFYQEDECLGGGVIAAVTGHVPSVQAKSA
jgi:tRNA-specific 2-thiouridylase